MALRERGSVHVGLNRRARGSHFPPISLQGAPVQGGRRIKPSPPWARLEPGGRRPVMSPAAVGASRAGFSTRLSGPQMHSTSPLTAAPD